MKAAPGRTRRVARRRREVRLGPSRPPTRPARGRSRPRSTSHERSTICMSRHRRPIPPPSRDGAGRTTTTASTAAPASCGTRRSSATTTSARAAHATTEDLCARLGLGAAAGRPRARRRQRHRRRGVPPGQGPTARRSPASIWPRRWSPSPSSAAASSGWPTRSSSSSATCSRPSFPEPFDIIWSRDAFMHIPDKPRLFSRLSSPAGPRRPAGHHRLRPRQDARLARVRGLHQEDRLSASSSPRSTASCSKRPAS